MAVNLWNPAFEMGQRIRTRSPERPARRVNRTSLQNTPLNLTGTLASGQSFRWRQSPDGAWWGVIGRTVTALRQEAGDPCGPLHWETYPENGRWDLIVDYFQLEVDLDRLYAEWMQAEPRIAPAIEAYRGLRILRQPPVECFFSFLCATCNTVVKIERTVSRLAERYGDPLDSPGGVSSFHAFPALTRLAEAEEGALRADLWGYRAPRVIALARLLGSKPPKWLEGLRAVPYELAKAELVQLPGIGPKLADCICLFCLDKDEAVPVDTHVRQIACRLFLPELAGKTLTPRVYDRIASTFRQRFGAYAGWAQQYLFFGELGRGGQAAQQDCPPEPALDTHGSESVSPPGDQ